MDIGQRFDENKFGVCEVLDDAGWDKVTIIFDNGFTTVTCRQQLLKGNVKSPYFPIVSGVGYFGEGIYVQHRNQKVTLEYNTWVGMLRRCYDEKTQLKYPTYIGCTVHPIWHNFQNFAEWCQTTVGFGNKGWELDKDITSKGNRQYGPTTCSFVPKEINVMLKTSSKHRGVYPNRGKL